MADHGRQGGGLYEPWDERAAGSDPALRFKEEQHAELLRTFYRSAGGDEHSD